MDSNLNSLEESLRFATSAMKAANISEEMKKHQQIIQKANEESIKNNEILLEGAKANITQNELLGQQLDFFEKSLNIYLILFPLFCFLNIFWNFLLIIISGIKNVINAEY